MQGNFAYFVCSKLIYGIRRCIRKHHNIEGNPTGNGTGLEHIITRPK